MPSWGVSGAPNFGLRRAKIGTRVGDGSYSNVTQVPSAQMMGVSLRVQTAELEGDDQITDSHGRAIKGTCRLRFGSVSLDVLKVITGQDIASSGTTPNRIERIKFRAEGFPYFGLIGLSEATNATGAMVIFAPKAKVVSDFSVGDFEYGRYTIPDLTVDLLPDDEYGNLATTEAQTVTLTNATGGTFTLSFQGQTTAAIPYNAASSAVDTALEALSTIGTGNVVVTGSAGGPYLVTFAGDLAEQALPALTANGASLTGSSPTIAVTETTPGVDPTPTIFEVIELETAPAVLSLPPSF